MNRVTLRGLDRTHSSSTGSPITLRTRPRVSFPTGTDTGAPEAFRFHSADEAFCRLERDGAHAAFADVLRNFYDEIDRSGDVKTFAGYADGGKDWRDLALRELNVDSGTRNLDHLAYRP